MLQVLAGSRNFLAHLTRCALGDSRPPLAPPPPAGTAPRGSPQSIHLCTDRAALYHRGPAAPLPARSAVSRDGRDACANASSTERSRALSCETTESCPVRCDASLRRTASAAEVCAHDAGQGSIDSSSL